MAQMQTLSARIPSDDVEWLAALQVAGATTPSDKLRALLAEFRASHEMGADFASHLAGLRQKTAPALSSIARYEHQTGKHSEPIRLIAEWATYTLATINAAAKLDPDSVEQAPELERRLVDRSLEHAAALVRLTITSAAPCFDPRSLDEKVIPLVQLCRIVDSTRKLTTEKTDG